MVYNNSSMNPTQRLQWGHVFSKVLIYLLVFYTFFMIGKSVWINYKLRQQIKDIESQISDIQKQNKNFENLIIYYQSDSFREVEARRKLGLKKADETVVAVPVKKYEDYNTETQTQKENIADISTSITESNASLWWQYFFK